MAVSEAHKRASNKWNSSRDNIMVRPSKEVGETIRAAAAAKGMSVQVYILQAVQEKMERERAGVLHDDLSAGGAGAEDEQRAPKGAGGGDDAGRVSIFPQQEPGTRRDS